MSNVQGIKPQLPAPVLTAVLSYIEGDVFRGSRRMPLIDVVHIITEDTLETVPGLLRGHIVTLRLALRSMKQTYGATPSPVMGSQPSRHVRGSCDDTREHEYLM